MSKPDVKFYLLELPHGKMFIDVIGVDAEIVNLLIQAMQQNPVIERLLITATVAHCHQAGRDIQGMLEHVIRQYNKT